MKVNKVARTVTRIFNQKRVLFNWLHRVVVRCFVGTWEGIAVKVRREESKGNHFRLGAARDIWRDVLIKRAIASCHKCNHGRIQTPCASGNTLSKKWIPQLIQANYHLYVTTQGLVPIPEKISFSNIQYWPVMSLGLGELLTNQLTN